VPVDLEVQLHDPALALYGGEDGLDVVRSISDRAVFLLKPAGQLVLEHADTQALAIRELLLAKGWQDVESFQDLAGKDRMTYARKP
jgi:release factor glutamine methyltransferase